MTNKTLLVITDGIGHNSSNNFNAFFSANTPTYDYLFKNTPYSLIHTYGKFVGLPDGQMGNSEVGHMTIGSGRILYQDLVKVNIAIENWYCEFVRPLQQFWDDAALVANEYNPNHLISYLYDDLQKTFEDLYETGIAKVESGFVSPISSISVQKNVTNVEQMMFALLTSE